MTTKTHLTKQEEGATERSVQVRASDPLSPVLNQVWINTTSKLLKWFDGAATQVIGPINTGGPTTIIGGGGSGDSLLDSLLQAEAADSGALQPDQILDTFDAVLGTLTGFGQGSSLLQFPALINAGTYQRVKAIATPVNDAEGIAAMRFHVCRPLTVNNGTNTVTFQGDVTQMFPATKPVLLYKITFTDIGPANPTGTPICLFLLDTNGVPVKLTVSTVSYNSGTDITTVVLNNPDGYAIDLGLSSGQLDAYWRMGPFDWSFKTSCTDVAGLQEIPITKIHNRRTIGIPSEQFFQKLFNLQGSLSSLTGKFDRAGVRGLVKFMMKEVGNANQYWQFGYTLDSGLSWQLFSTKKPANTTWSADQGNAEYVSQADNFAIADNGKFFITYQDQSGIYLKGVYGDLSVAIPTINDCAVTTSGVPSGYIWSGGTMEAHVKADLTDLSYICVLANRSDSTLVAFFFTNGGATYKTAQTLTGSSSQASMLMIHITGVAGSRKTHVMWRYTANGYYYGCVLTEGSEGVSAVSYHSGSNVSGDNSYLIDTKVSPNEKYIVNFYRDNGSGGFTYQYLDIQTPTNTTWSSWFRISAPIFDGAFYNGTIWSNTSTQYNTINKRLWIDPANDKHFIAVFEAYNGSSELYPYLIEVQDLTAPRFSRAPGNTTGIYQNSIDTAWPLNYNATNGSMQAQTLTLTGQTIKSVILRMYQNNYVGSPNGTSGGSTKGKNIRLEIWNTSAGLPTSLANPSYVSQWFDVTKLNRSGNWQGVLFSFPGYITLTGTYALVLVSDWSTLDTSNYINLATYSGNNYSGGQWYGWNGTSWVNQGSGYDFWMDVSGENMQLMADPDFIGYSNCTPQYYAWSYGETQMYPLSGAIGDSSFRFITRRYQSFNTGQDELNTGIPRQRTITFNGGGAPATISAASHLHVADSDWDDDICFNFSLGHPEADTYDIYTGSQTGWQLNDLSENNLRNNSNNMTIASFVSDSQFQSGRCAEFNGSSLYNNYEFHAGFTLRLGDFAIEAEIKPTSVGGGNKRNIISATASYDRWAFCINENGFLEFWWNPESGAIQRTVASDKVEPSTYHKVKVVVIRDQNNSDIGTRLYRHEGTGWVEVASYSLRSSAPVAGSYTLRTYNPGGTVYIGLGNGPGSGYFAGRIGYIRATIGFGKHLATGGAMFKYEGFKPQRPFVQVIGMGKTQIGQKVLPGSNSTSIYYNNGYDNVFRVPGYVRKKSALSDSYDMDFYFAHQSPVAIGQMMALKIMGNRGGSQNQTSIDGVNFRFFHS